MWLNKVKVCVQEFKINCNTCLNAELTDDYGLLAWWMDGSMETEETKLFFIYKSVSGACRKTQGISRRGGAADILTPVSVHSPGEPDKMVSI